MSAISFPGQPDEIFEYINIELSHSFAQAQSRGNMVSEVQFADPSWIGELHTVALDKDDYPIWDTFITKAQDQSLSIDFVNPLFLCPRAYNVSTIPVGNLGTLVSFTSSKDIIVAGLTVGMILQAGDRFTLKDGETLSHHKVSTDVTVSSGTVQHVLLTPRVPAGLITPGASVLFLNPPIRLRITPNSWKAPVEAGKAIYGSFTVYEANR